MAVAAPNRPAVIEADRRFVLYGVGWRFYETFLAELGERHLFLTFDRGNLEIMSPSHRHEAHARLLAIVIGIVAEELNIPIKGGRSTTFRRQDLERGLEPDECFWIAREPQVRGKMGIDLASDPPPDLAVEVEITRGALDRMGIYSALGVPEIWRFDGRTLTAHDLQADGTYATVSQSPTFPILPLPEVLRRLSLAETMDETSWTRSIREWVRFEILPRFQEAADEGPHP
jgi:Uma2 family endonuclease